MEQNENLSFFKWITNIGIVVFIAFTYLYVGPVAQMQSELDNLNEQIEVENSNIDNTSSNSTKRQLIQANIARAENAASKSVSLSVSRIFVGIFVLAGLGMAGYGAMNVRKIIQGSEEEEI